MEDILKRLLEVELKAEAQVEDASRQREQLIRQALEDTRQGEARFAEHLPSLRAPYLSQAEDRAAQAVAELKKKYEERQKALRALAERHHQEAAEAALRLLLGDPGH